MEIYGHSATFQLHEDVAQVLREMQSKSKRIAPNLLNSLDAYVSYCIYNKLPELQQTVRDLEIKEAERKYKQYYGIK